MATPSVSLNHDKTPLGSPIDITYKFVVANDAQFTEDLRVMVHVVDADEELIFAFDHNPPVPTTQWKPGQTIEYTKTVFVPIYPYVGEATIQVGPALDRPRRSGSRSPATTRASAPTRSRRCSCSRRPRTSSRSSRTAGTPGKIAEHNATVEWQWTKKDATLSFKNPKKDSVFYLRRR